MGASDEFIADSAFVKCANLEKQTFTYSLFKKLKASRLFLEMNDVVVNWKKIRGMLPTIRRYALDRIPPLDELREIVDTADNSELSACLSPSNKVYQNYNSDRILILYSNDFLSKSRLAHSSISSF